EFHDASLIGVTLRQAIQGIIESQYTYVGPDNHSRIWRQHGIALGRISPPRMVYQDTAHGLRRNHIEMFSALEIGLAVVHQPKVGLMHERGNLKRLTRALSA